MFSFDLSAFFYHRQGNTLANSTTVRSGYWEQIHKHWNRLPKKLTLPPPLEIFRNRLDKCVRNYAGMYAYILPWGKKEEQTELSSSVNPLSTQEQLISRRAFKLIHSLKKEKKNTLDCLCDLKSCAIFPLFIPVACIWKNYSVWVVKTHLPRNNLPHNPYYGRLPWSLPHAGQKLVLNVSFIGIACFFFTPNAHE